MSLCNKLFEIANNHQEKRSAVIDDYLTKVCKKEAEKGEYDVEIIYGVEISGDGIIMHHNDVLSFAEKNDLEYVPGCEKNSVLVSWRKLF